MKFHNMDIDQVFTVLQSRDSGLTIEEVNVRCKRDGKNKIIEKRKESYISKFLKEFKDLMIVILIVAAGISFLLSWYHQEPFIDSIIIIIIVILNAIMGFVQELKADKAIESLKKMQVSNVRVKREGKLFLIPSEDIVVGDILFLEAGDTIPADARIIWESSLKVDESSLTGESVSVSKTTDTLVEEVSLSLRKNMVFSGTNIVYGKCYVVVCQIGMNTEFGKIAKVLNEQEQEVTPLQRKINGISRFLSVVIVITIFIMFIVGLIKGMNILEIFMLSISLAVAAIPEGLPAIITVILSLGMSTLAKKNAIVRKMLSVETLGQTEIICSDKTGTITQNKMKIKEVYYDKHICNYHDLLHNNILLLIMALNNDVEKNGESYIGDPTEIALYEACEECFDVNFIRNNYPKIDELPFDSERKMMSTIHKFQDSIKMYTKGSFESVINRCSYIYENDQIVKLTLQRKIELTEIEEKECNQAYRVLAYAYKEIEGSYQLDLSLENDLIFVGLTSMFDPPRADVKEAIKECKMAHIKPIMITGDSLSTAVSIAKDIGILQDEKEAISGMELDAMSKEELIENVHKYSVYARVSPMNKLDIVNAWKDTGKIVAMTGDGVNDAPALKNADIGIGMGIAGTEVSKSVSDIVLLDDSFSTIVTAVKEGRQIYDHIRKALLYLLTGNIAEILIVFIGMLCGIEIFLPIQLLYINLVTDSLPAISLAFESEEQDIMSQKIRKKDSSFFTPFLIAKIVLSAILKTIAILVVYFVNLKLYSVNVAMTSSFLTLILLEIIFAYSCKNLKSNVCNKRIFNNSVLNRSTLLLFVVQLILFATPMKRIFRIVDLNILQLLLCFAVVLIVFFTDEFFKKIICRIFQD